MPVKKAHMLIQGTNTMFLHTAKKYHQTHTDHLLTVIIIITMLTILLGGVGGVQHIC